MKSWLVTFERTVKELVEIVVEAKTEQQAIDKVRKNEYYFYDAAINDSEELETKDFKAAQYED